MSGERNLELLIARMAPTLDPETYVFTPLGEPDDASSLRPRLLFEEEEGVTAVVPRAVARTRGLTVDFPAKRITLNVHSALDAVGFLAAVTGELARHGIAVNAVSAYHHDHLFVPEARADEALAILERMAARAATPGP
jgi:hypothetical protein